MKKTYEEKMKEALEATEFYDIEWKDKCGIKYGIACVPSEKDEKWKQCKARSKHFDMQDLKMTRRSDGMIIATFWRDKDGK